MDPVWSLLIVGTGCVPWVELVQRRLCPIFVSGVGLTSTSIPQVDGLSTNPRNLGRHMDLDSVFPDLPFLIMSHI